MDFKKYESFDGVVKYPYAGRTPEGEWLAGTIPLEFLQEHFGHCETLDECITSTESESLRLLFGYLKLQQ